jgi:hypothetical protein
VTMSHPGFLCWKDDIGGFLRFGLGSHVQEGVGPEDVGSHWDHPGVRQHKCPWARENDSLLTVGAQ